MALEGPDGEFASPTRRLAAPQGRWQVPDPAGLAAVDPSNPQSWNRYAYVMNNPATSTDPLGLFTDAVTPSGHGNCAIDGQAVSCAAMQGLASEGGGGETGTVINGDLNAVAVRGAGWAFPSVGANNSLNWSFSFSAAYNGQTLTNAGLAETLGLPTGTLASAANNCQAPFPCNTPSSVTQPPSPKQPSRKYSDYVSCVIGGWADSKLMSFITADLLAYKASTPLARTGTSLISGGRFSPAVQATADHAFYVFVGATAFYAVESAASIRSSCTAEVYGR